MLSWRAAGWIDRVVIEGILIRTHDGRWRLVDTPPQMFRRSGFLTSVCSLSSEQVSVAKVLLGVFGLAVVVILIAVPTAVYLNGESDVGMHYAGAITHDPLTGTGAGEELEKELVFMLRYFTKVTCLPLKSLTHFMTIFT